VSPADAEAQEQLFLPSRRERPEDADRSAVDRPPWHPSLTQRLRVLLHTTPLHDQRRSDALRDAELRHYDSLTLAMKVIDTIIDKTGLEQEANRRDVEQALLPLLRAMDEAAGVAADPGRHTAIVDKVLGGLRNDAAGRRPFAIDYCDFDDAGLATGRRLEFRLVSDAFDPAGGTVLRLSNEAVNLYLNALELDIEDAQAAAEAIVQSQLARGRFDEAVQSARQARWQSLRYRDKVLRIVRETQRDIDRVDWHHDVPRLLEEAWQHIERRLETELGIVQVAHERLQVLPEGDRGAAAVARVAELIRDCHLRHMELHEQLMKVRNVFLDTQARQAFVPAPVRALPDLRDEVLEPLLRLGRDPAAAVLERGFPLLVGAQAPPLLSLDALVAWLLQPRRAVRRDEIPLELPDLAQLAAELGRYPGEVRDETAELLAEVHGSITLSELLAHARAQGVRPATLELLVLLALQQYDPDVTATLALRSERVPGAALRDPAFHGDELELLPMRANDDAIV